MSQVECVEEQASIVSGDGWGAFSLLGEGRAGETVVQQDALRIVDSWMGDENRLLGIVCDGHSTHGELAARYVTESLPDLLYTMGYAQNHPGATRRACRYLDRRIEKMSPSSGTTMVMVDVSPQYLFIASVGDSRATGVNQKHLTRLTRDHHVLTATSSELNVMRRKGGVFHREEEGGYRFLLSLDMRMGTPLSRSIGDAAFGRALSSQPETKVVSWHDLEDHRYLVLWVDGVWGCFAQALVPQSWIVQWFHEAQSPERIARLLSSEIMNRCPVDNASAIIIDLDRFRPS